MTPDLGIQLTVFNEFQGFSMTTAKIQNGGGQNTTKLKTTLGSYFV